MKYLNITDARGKLRSLVEAIEETALVRNGEPVGVVMNMDRYESLRALSALADSGKLASAYESHRKALADDTDDYKSLDDLRALAGETVTSGTD